MKLEQADWQTLLPVFRETYQIWSPGLSRSDYLEYQEKQIDDLWARRNLRHLALMRGQKVLSSLKLSKLNLQIRDRTIPIGGIGAVYTQLDSRNQGYASELLDQTIDLAKEEGMQALLLFSDIDCEFYSRLGFDEIGSADMLIYLPSNKNHTHIPDHFRFEGNDRIIVESDGRQVLVDRQELSFEHLAEVARHHRQWLRLQPYGIERDERYFHFKLMRESYLHNHSRLSWPALKLTTASFDGNILGYAITESAGGVLRVLEVVGKGSTRDAIWGALLVRALKDRLSRVRAWEALAQEFAPSYSLNQVLHRLGLKAVTGESYKGQLNYYQRSWGKGMIMPLEEELEGLCQIAPCPLVELDHL